MLKFAYRRPGVLWLVGSGSRSRSGPSWRPSSESVKVRVSGRPLHVRFFPTYEECDVCVEVEVRICGAV